MENVNENESITQNVVNSTIALNLVGCKNTKIENVDITFNNYKPDSIDVQPPKPIKTFRGRNEELDHLKRLMFDEDQRRIVIYGLPGMGKTELANQFAMKSLDEGKINEIIWIDAEDLENVEKTFNSIAESYHIKIFNKRKKIKLIYERLKDSNYLFVFDNCEEDDKLEDFLPPEEFYLLITSKVQEWGDDFQTILLEELSADAALLVAKSILSTHYKLEYLDKYKELAQFVSYVPLGLQIVFCYVKRTYDQGKRHFNFDHYFEQLNSQNDILDLQIHKKFKNPYKKSVYKAVCTSMLSIFEDQSQLKNIRNLSQLVLCVTSLLYPDKIYFPILQHYINTGKIGDDRYVQDDIEIALYSISNYNILKYTDMETSLKIHRLVQKILRYYFETKCFKTYSKCFIAIIYLQPITDEVKDDGDDDSITVITYEYYPLHFIDINLDILKTFYNKYMAKNINKYSTFLTTLARYGCMKSVQYLFENVSISKSELITKHLLIHGAIEGNSVKMLEYLLEDYNDINIYDKRSSILHTAAYYSNLAAIKICIAKKADVFIKNKVFETPLFEFCRFSREGNNHVEEILELLQPEECKAILNHRQASALHAACSGYCNEHVINLLINKYHYDVNKQDECNNTPLHYLYFTENRDTAKRKRIIRLFEESNADFSMKNNFDKTCIEMSNCENLFEN